MDGRRRALLFREVNDRIGELVERAGWAAEGDFLCECGHEDCSRRVTLRLHEYEAVRRRGVAVLAAECGGVRRGRQVARASAWA